MSKFGLGDDTVLVHVEELEQIVVGVARHCMVIGASSKAPSAKNEVILMNLREKSRQRERVERTWTAEESETFCK